MKQQLELAAANHVREMKSKIDGFTLANASMTMESFISGSIWAVKEISSQTVDTQTDPVPAWFGLVPVEVK